VGKGKRADVYLEVRKRRGHKLFIFPSKVSRLVTFKIMRRLKVYIELHRNNLTKTRKKW
jgi:Holliday junction resolvase